MKKKKKNELNPIIQDFPSVICFAKSFLSFSESQKVAENFISQNPQNPELVKVLFTLKSDPIGDLTPSHVKIPDILSFHPDEEEVLFFPYSSFELQSIREVKEKNRYEIELLYLGKYRKNFEKVIRALTLKRAATTQSDLTQPSEVQKSVAIQQIQDAIPDSKFKDGLVKSKLVEKTKIDNITIKNLVKHYIKIEQNVINNREKSSKDSLPNKKIIPVITMHPFKNPINTNNNLNNIPIKQNDKEVIKILTPENYKILKKAYVQDFPDAILVNSLK